MSLLPGRPEEAGGADGPQLEAGQLQLLPPRWAGRWACIAPAPRCPPGMPYVRRASETAPLAGRAQGLPATRQCSARAPHAVPATLSLFVLLTVISHPMGSVANVHLPRDRIWATLSLKPQALSQVRLGIKMPLCCQGFMGSPSLLTQNIGQIFKVIRCKNQCDTEETWIKEHVNVLCAKINSLNCSLENGKH